MPLYLIVLLLITLVGTVIFAVVSERRENNRREEAVRRSFGKIPEPEELPEGTDTYYVWRSTLNPEMELDDQTWDDLDMEEVFSRLNACQCSVGESVLYDLLHRIEPSADLRLAMAYFEAKPDERQRIQLLLSKLGRRNPEGMVNFLYDDFRRELPYPLLCTILAVLPLVCAVSIFFFPIPGTVALTGSVALNIVLHLFWKRKILTELSGITEFISVLWLCRSLTGKNMEQGFPFASEMRSRLAFFNRRIGALPLRPFRGSADMDLIQEYSSAIFLSDLRKFNRIVRPLEEHREDGRRLFELIGMLDAAASVLSFRKSLSFFCTPEFRSGYSGTLGGGRENNMEFEDLCHPLLQFAVPNTGVFFPDVLITGSNASGKSTFLKALAVNAILAQTLDTCAARRFVLRPGLVISSMAVRDSLTAGESYFITEIKSLKRILDAAGKGFCYCFIDEILRGTNSVERIAASVAVLTQLHRWDCLCVVASHDMELAQLLQPDYDNYHFSEVVTEDGVSFDFLLKKGPSDTRNAILLLEQMGFGNGIVQDARRRAEQIAAQKGIEDGEQLQGTSNN